MIFKEQTTASKELLSQSTGLMRETIYRKMAQQMVCNIPFEELRNIFDFRELDPYTADLIYFDEKGREILKDLKRKDLSQFLAELNTDPLRWIPMTIEPVFKDLPFVTYNKNGFEFWEDTDWFNELTEKDRLSWSHWARIRKPKS